MAWKGYFRRSNKYREREEREERERREYRERKPKREPAVSVPPSEPEEFTYHFSPQNDRQRDAIALAESCDLLGLIGPRGCGKTITAAALAVGEVFHGRAKRIVLIRPCVEAGENPLGFLSGDLQDKTDPYYAVLQKNIAKVGRKFPSKKLERVVLNFIRGETFDDSVMVVDEAQNFTLKELTDVLGTMGKRSRLILMGDPEQVDIKRSGLVEFFNRLHGGTGVGCVWFCEEDILRNPLLESRLKRLRR